MDFVAHTAKDWKEMLGELGVASLQELLRRVLPPNLKYNGSHLEPGLSEFEVLELMKSKAALNATVESFDNFLGAGVYHHFIPSVVGQLASRSEFFTAYTPYQPEASQGTLQAIFEYQTLIARLTDLEVSNASLYDGASALAEAVLMAMAIRNDGGRILVSQTIHPEYRAVVKTYLGAKAESVVEIPYKNGLTDLERLEDELKKGATALCVQWPNFFGCLEDLETAGQLAHRYGALFIVSTYPVALGFLKSPGKLGADICVGDGQSLGNSLQFGGPYFGFMACRKEYVRKMPGRIVGLTQDIDGKRGFVLTLQAREQHIRREKATSNICTNQSLNALTGAIFLAMMGPEGLQKMAALNLKKAHFAAEQLSKIPGCSLAFSAPFFNEFVLRLPVRPEDFVRKMNQRKIIPGLVLRRFYPELDDALLVCVTEVMSRAKIERFAQAVAEEVEEKVLNGKNTF